MREDNAAEVIVEGESLDQLEAAQIVKEHEVLSYHCDCVYVHPHALHVLSERYDVDAFFSLEVPHHNVFLRQRPHRWRRTTACCRRVTVFLKQPKVLRAQLGRSLVTQLRTHGERTDLCLLFGFGRRLYYGHDVWRVIHFDAEAVHRHGIFRGRTEDHLKRAKTVNVKPVGFGASHEAGTVLIEAAVSNLFDWAARLPHESLLINHFVS